MKKESLLEYLKYIKNTNSYNSKYGFDLIFTITILGGLLIGNLYLYLRNNKKYLINNWNNERCKPYIIPFAGFIHSEKVDDQFLFTNDNFSYCLEGILSTLITLVLEPINVTVSSVLETLNMGVSKLDNLNGLFSDLFGNLTSYSNKLNIIVKSFMETISKILVSIVDIITRTMNIIDYVFNIIGELFNSIIKIVKDSLTNLMFIMIGFIVLLALLFIGIIIAFIWFPLAIPVNLLPVSAGMVTVLIILSIIPILISVLNNSVQTPTEALEAYKDGCCFDKNTQIKTKYGNKPISELKINDILEDNSKVTGIFKVKYNNNIIYKIGEIYVTPEHNIYYNKKWIRVDQHPNSILIKNYNEKYLYCINTTNKVIKINNYIFQDWDELDEDDIDDLKTITGIQDTLDINLKLEHGFFKSTKIELNNGESKDIIDIKVGDILKNNNKVMGKGIVNAKGNKNIYEYSFNNNKKVICSSNTLPLKITNNMIKKNEKIKCSKLYSLLTETGKIEIDGVIFYHYNDGIEKYIE